MKTRPRAHSLFGLMFAAACVILPTTSHASDGFDARDGVFINNVFAAYTHLHALATPEWAEGILAAARRYRKSR